MRTVGQALQDPQSGISRAAVELSRQRAIRMAKAEEIAQAEGIPLATALLRVYCTVMPSSAPIRGEES